MWIYDGEQWIEEGGTPKESKDTAMPQFDQFVPELQIVEIVPLPKPQYVPFTIP